MGVRSWMRKWRELRELELAILASHSCASCGNFRGKEPPSVSVACKLLVYRSHFVPHSGQLADNSIVYIRWFTDEMLNEINILNRRLMNFLELYLSNFKYIYKHNKKYLFHILVYVSRTLKKKYVQTLKNTCQNIIEGWMSMSVN